MNLKVLMFGWEFHPYNSGGLGVACKGLSSSLADQGISLTFVLPKKLAVSSSSFRFLFADIGTDGFLFNSPLRPYITSGIYDELRGISSLYGANLFEEVSRYAHFAGEIARTHTFDLIHAHDWLSFPAGIEAKRVSGKPLIAHVHATEFDRTGGISLNRHVYDTELLGLREANAVLAVSDFTKKSIVEHYQIPSQKVSVVRNGASFVHTGPYKDSTDRLLELKRKGKKIVCYVGRLTLQKGPDYLLQAIPKVIEYNPDVLFIFSGAGDMERKLVEETARLQISDHVIFAGFLRGNELAALYEAADLYVMPSVSEPFGLTSIEALKYGTPVLISKQSGVSSLLSHALKVDFWDTDEMAHKILSVLSHTSLHNTLAEHGRMESEKFSWERAAKDCVGVYQSVLA